MIRAYRPAKEESNTLIIESQPAWLEGRNSPQRCCEERELMNTNQVQIDSKALG